MARRNKVPELPEEQRVAHVNAGIAKHPGFSEGDIEDMRKSAAFIADPKNAIRGLLVEGTLKHDAERPVFYSKNGWEPGQEGFQGDRFSMVSSLDDGRVVVFPSIYADKDGVTRLHTGKDAFDHYQKTGEHFGIYDSVENANRVAKWSHHAGNAGWLKRHEKQQDAKGGDAPGASAETPPSGPAPAQPQGGPRIVINPSTFHNEKDAACVMWNEAFRVVMEDLEFEPQSEPTDAQRKFFSDTAYSGDELQLRRTILARICTFDTSVEDPTDEQLQEAVEFLETVMEIGAPQNEWEQKAVQRLHDVIAASVGRRPEEAAEAEPPEDEGTVQGAVGGGMTDEERNRPENMVDAEGARAAEVAIGAPSYQQGDENLPGPDQQAQAGQAQAPAGQAGQAQAPAEQKAQPQAANAEQSPTDRQVTTAQPEKPAQKPVADMDTERFLYSWSSSGQMDIGGGSMVGTEAADVGAAGASQPIGRLVHRRRIGDGQDADQSNKKGGYRMIGSGQDADQSSKKGGHRSFYQDADQSRKKGGYRPIEDT